MTEGTRTNNRRYLLWLLLILLIFVPPLLGLIGPVELIIWAALLVGWVVAFFTWASPEHTGKPVEGSRS